MKIYAAANKGINKIEIEDRIVINHSIISNGTFCNEFDTGILAIADGVGGNNAGAVASQFVASRLCNAENVSESIFLNINSELIHLSNEKSEYNGMATTLSGIEILNDSVTLFSIGNTRVYLVQSGKYLKQLTTDDTTLNYLLSIGFLTSEEIKTFNKKNEITACFGGGDLKLFKIKISEIGILNSPIMMTSDGIHDYLTIDQMEAIIAEYGLTETACEMFIKAARNNGSCDDISIIIGDL